MAYRMQNLEAIESAYMSPSLVIWKRDELKQFTLSRGPFMMIELIGNHEAKIKDIDTQTVHLAALSQMKPI